jgi:hypothetical protein
MEIPSVTSQLQSQMTQMNKQDPNKPVPTPQANGGQGSVGDLAVSQAVQPDKGQQVDPAA